MKPIVPASVLLALGLACSPGPAPVPEVAYVPPSMEIDPARAAEAGQSRDDNALGMIFRRCPPGSFRMGRGKGAVGVLLSKGYWMGQHEVTQGQWLRVMGSTLREQRARDPDQPRPLGDGSTRDHVGEGPDHPIYFVNHDEAREFCRKLSDQERAAGRLPEGLEYRLPTEAQWEFACRAGTSTATPFGDGLSSLDANFDGSKPYGGVTAGPYLKETTPVGGYPANAWGLRDMLGNVWEWCLDGHSEALPGGIDPTGPASPPARRTYRGGCWHNPGSLCLSTSRAWGQPGDRGSGLGFRAALVASDP